VLSLPGTSTLLVIRSTCPDLPQIFTHPGNVGDIGATSATATYPLAPGGYRVTSP
jgi:hypothetical protein